MKMQPDNNTVPEPVEHPYADYYLRALEETDIGFKLVIGGTGLGKTAAIADVVRQNPDRKFVYVANRRRLLSEMEARAVTELPVGSHVRIHRDIDQLTIALRSEALDDLLHSTHASRVEELYFPLLQQSHALRAVERIRELVRNDLPGNLLYELLEDEARYVMRFCRQIVRTADGALNNQAVVQALFPFIKFMESDHTNFALVTLQKLFYGVFDGKEDVDIDRLSHCIVFLDEFDFLEQNLLDMLCRAPEVDNVFEFVAPFYRVMHFSRLPHPYYAEDQKDLKDRLKQIIALINEIQNRGLDFPQYTQSFVPVDVSLPDGAVQLFHTDRTISTTILLVRQGSRGFEIAPAAQVQWAKAENLSFLLGRLQNVSRRILTLFKEYKMHDPAIFDELRRQCYGQSRSQYNALLDQIGLFPRKSLRAYNGFDSLLSSGYNVFEIQDLHQYTDPGAIEIRGLALLSTPERLLHDLATDNLVFGLSATADIDRCLHNFDLRWLRQQTDVKWLEISEIDKNLVKAVAVAKQQQRGNALFVHRLPLLSEPRLERAIRLMSQQDEFAENKANVHHRGRVENFFRALEWLSTDGRAGSAKARSTNLMFVSSYRQIRFLFGQQSFRKIDGVYEISDGKEAKTLTTYTLRFREEQYLVAFLDSEVGESLLATSEDRLLFNQLFWQGLPVIIVTQYASAGAGVNLQYPPHKDAQEAEWEDFTQVYFLDLPFYFFEVEGRQSVARKKNIWHLAKLFYSKQISSNEFRRLLGEVNGGKLSTMYINGYRTCEDALLNRVVVLIQAFGRIERAWHNTPDQHVVLASEVFDQLARYALRPEYEQIRQKRLVSNSPNVTALLEKVKEIAVGDQREARIRKDRKLSVVNAACRDAIDGLVKRLESLRAGNVDDDIRSVWEKIRVASLQHDFAYAPGSERTPLLERYHMLYRTPFIREGTVYVDSDVNLLDPVLQSGRKLWLDAVYEVIRDNDIVNRYFKHHGYELGFAESAGIIFTPEAYQEVLIGAVGEAGIKAILIDYLGADCFEELPDKLYELVDFKLSGHQIFIDAKYYSEQTLLRFGLEASHPDRHPKLNSDAFRRKAQTTLEAIRSCTGSYNCKLIFINLVASGNRGLELFTEDFQRVRNLNRAQIAIVQGAIDRDNPYALTHEMQTLLAGIGNEA